ncbi:hypothetical protein DFJ74DRAFT_712155 [Hyaloraphidium curvatum]|nr:hypothetical protein DFJ74DRAFT_712155 [Hyaloraphidium curvatum]
MAALLAQAVEFAKSHPVRAIAAASVASLVALRVVRLFKPKPAVPKDAVVLVTGCDSGMGNATAKLLSERTTADGAPEFTVLAGCLTDAGIQELTGLGRKNLVPFKLDVTSDESAKAAFALADKYCDGKGLFALYNIAGIAMFDGFSDLSLIDDWKKVFEVNFFGVLRMTQVMMPLLHQSAYLARLSGARGAPLLQPKIIVVTSVASEIGGAGGGSYTSSKHAAKALCNSLRAELAPFGISVVEIRPFWVATNIVPRKDTIDAAAARFKAKFDGARGNEADPFGRESPINRYVGGADALASRWDRILDVIPPPGKMLPASAIAEAMEREMRSAEPRQNVMLTNRFRDRVLYYTNRFAPSIIGHLTVAGAKENMKGYVREVAAPVVQMERMSGEKMVAA